MLVLSGCPPGQKKCCVVIIVPPTRLTTLFLPNLTWPAFTGWDTVKVIQPPKFTPDAGPTPSPALTVPGASEDTCNALGNTVVTGPVSSSSLFSLPVNELGSTNARSAALISPPVIGILVVLFILISPWPQ